MNVRVRILFADAALGDEIAALLREFDEIAILTDSDDIADVVITDVRGLHATLTETTNADREHARAPIVALVNPDERALTNALRRGAHAALPEHATGEQILAAAQAAAAGLVARPWRRATHVNDVRASIDDETDSDSITVDARTGSTPSTPLTPRERDVLRLLAEGLGNKTIAQRLSIAPDTVKAHVSSILTKLGARTRTEAVAIGAREGLIIF